MCITELMVGGNNDFSISFGNAADILRAKKVVQENQQLREDSGVNNPANQAFPEAKAAKKPPSPTQSGTLAQAAINDGFDEKKNSVEAKTEDPRSQARKAQQLWGDLNPNSTLLDDNDSEIT